MDPNPMLLEFLRLLFEGHEVMHVEASPGVSPVDPTMARTITFHWSKGSRPVTLDKFEARWLELVGYLSAARWPGKFGAPASYSSTHVVTATDPNQ